MRNDDVTPRTSSGWFAAVLTAAGCAALGGQEIATDDNAPAISRR